MRPVHLLVVEVAEVRLETPSVGRVRVGVAAEVPLAHHVRLIAGFVHVFRQELWFVVVVVCRGCGCGGCYVEKVYSSYVRISVSRSVIEWDWVERSKEWSGEAAVGTVTGAVAVAAACGRGRVAGEGEGVEKPILAQKKTFPELVRSNLTKPQTKNTKPGASAQAEKPFDAIGLDGIHV